MRIRSRDRQSTRLDATPIVHTFGFPVHLRKGPFTMCYLHGFTYRLCEVTPSLDTRTWTSGPRMWAGGPRLMKSTGWTAPTEPSRIGLLYFLSADVAFRYKQPPYWLRDAGRNENCCELQRIERGPRTKVS